MDKALSYQDVYLVPRYSELKSRSEADISVEFLGRRFKAPWIPANMESVVDDSICHWLSQNDYFYVMHRFCDNYKFVQLANKEDWNLISISVGVKQEDKDLITWIVENHLRVDYVTIDIAHGHSILMKEMIRFIMEKRFPTYSPKIIAGNVATPEAVSDLAKWGADAVKIGIAGGGACSTKHQTGFHVPMFTCVQSCESEGGPLYAKFNFRGKAEIPIIADGGVRENGDVAKALVAGATMVMAGGLFAACKDAPGENLYDRPFSTNPDAPIPKITYKNYHGSASAKQKGERKHVEGFEIQIPCNGMTYEEKYQELTESLKSAISYAGGKDLTGFNKVAYITTK